MASLPLRRSSRAPVPRQPHDPSSSKTPSQGQQPTSIINPGPTPPVVKPKTAAANKTTNKAPKTKKTRAAAEPSGIEKLIICANSNCSIAVKLVVPESMDTAGLECMFCLMKEVRDLRLSVNGLHEELTRNDTSMQRSLKSTVRITGVPEAGAGIGVADSVLQIGQTMGIPLSSHQVVSARRVGPSDSGRIRPIIVEFNDEATAINYLRNRKTLASRMAPAGAGTALRVCVKEELTPERWRLFQVCKDIHGLAAVYTRRGTIICKKMDSGSVEYIRINCHADLYRIIDRSLIANNYNAIIAPRSGPQPPPVNNRVNRQTV